MQQKKTQAGVFVTGTDTDVGKTWLGQAVIRQLNEQGVKVVPRKPVESGWLDDVNKTDAWRLAKVGGCEQELEKVCPNHFKAAVSPVRAASLEGRALRLDTVTQQCFEGVEESSFLYVEGAGGFFSPLVAKEVEVAKEKSNGVRGLNADLAKSLNLPVLLVANDKLGCINHVLLTLAAIESYELPVVAVVLNSVDKTVDSNGINFIMNNLEDLEDLLDVPMFHIQHGQSTVSADLVELMLYGEEWRGLEETIIPSSST